MSTTKNPANTTFSLVCPCGLPEEWRPVSRMPGYEVSDHGRLRKYLTGATHLKKGYKGRYNESRLAKHHRVHVHVLVAEAFLGPRPPGPNPKKLMEVNHKDNNGLNNHLSNLEYVTHQENMLHSVRNGYHKYGVGENATRWKVSNTKAQEILDTYLAGGTSLRELASLHGITYGCVAYIVKHRKGLSRGK